MGERARESEREGARERGREREQRKRPAEDSEPASVLARTRTRMMRVGALRRRSDVRRRETDGEASIPDVRVQVMQSYVARTGVLSNAANL